MTENGSQGGSTGGGSSGSRTKQRSLAHQYRTIRHGRYFGRNTFRSRRDKKGLCQCLVMCFVTPAVIVTLIASFFLANVVTTDYRETIEPGDTYLIDTTGYSALELKTNSIRCYLFKTMPTLSSSGNMSKNSTFNMTGYYNDYYSARLNKGSNGFVAWNSTNDTVDFYVIKGGAQYKDFQDGKANSYVTNIKDQNYTYSVNITEDDYYYFLWKGSDSLNLISTLLEIEKFDYDTDKADSNIANERKIPITEDFKYIVLVNEASRNDIVMFTLVTGQERGDVLMPIFFGTLIATAVVIVLLLCLVPGGDDKGTGTDQTDGFGQPVSESPTEDSSQSSGKHAPAGSAAIVQPTPKQAGQSRVQGGPTRPQSAPIPHQQPKQPSSDIIDICPYCGSFLDNATKQAYRDGKAFCKSCGKQLR